MDTWAGDGIAPGRGRAPLLVAALLPLVTLALAAVGHYQLGASPVFVPVWLVLVLAFDALTVALLIGQYRAGGNPRVLALTWAYVWSGSLTLAILVTLRGALTPDGLIDVTAEEITWLMCVRLVGGPALVVVSLVPWTAGFERWMRGHRRRTPRILGTQLGVFALALVLILIVVKGPVPLPRITQAGSGLVVLDSGVNRALVVINLVLLAVGLLGVRTRRRVQGIEAWAIVALVATCGGTILTLVSAAPYDVAWYGARTLGLVATFMVLNGLLRDVGHLQGQVRDYARQLEGQNHQLTEAQGLRDHLVAVVSHDMRNPLAGLTGYLELLAHDHDLTPAEVRRAHARSRSLARRLTLMTEDLLVSATTADLSVLPLPVELRGELDECAGGFPDVDVVLHCDDDLHVEADPLRLQQVLANLVGNAQQYGAQPVRIHATRHGSTARIAVSDAGAGVPDDFVPRLFDRYTRADPTLGRGSGLGLSISRGLVERHGGTLAYEPATREFVVLLPAVQPQRPKAGFSLARNARTPSVKSGPV